MFFVVKAHQCGYEVYKTNMKISTQIILQKHKEEKLFINVI